MAEGAALVVCWFDPGMTTGWALVKVPMARLLTEGQVGSVRWTSWKCGQFGGGSGELAERTSVNVDRSLSLARRAYAVAPGVGDVFVLGAENFTLRMLSMEWELLEPVRWLAVMRDRLRPSGMELEVQEPADALRTITEARLMSWGMYNSSAEHGRSAMSHALLFLRRWAKDPRLRERAGVEVVDEGSEESDD
jgi:hypothetical protein